jgi:NAD(P)-dependent dehydrogenase (short-subunit alcohol dehydrogenase family)
MDLQLTNKVAIVTGGTSGIGEAIVKSLAQEGVILSIVGRDKDRGDHVVAGLTAQGYKAIFVQAELAEEAACKTVVDATLAAFGRIDILINNAGVNDGASLEHPVSNFVASLHKNLVHYFAMVHYALPALKESKGVVINIGSKVADTGQGATSGYAASKGGIHALTREWAAGLRNFGIRVNEVVPAEVWTPLYEWWVGTFDDPAKKKAEIESKIPFGARFTTSEEIADMVVFLVSARSSHTTGQIIYVDGGYTHLDRSLT